MSVSSFEQAAQEASGYRSRLSSVYKNAEAGIVEPWSGTTDFEKCETYAAAVQLSGKETVAGMIRQRIRFAAHHTKRLAALLDGDSSYENIHNIRNLVVTCMAAGRFLAEELKHDCTQAN